MQDLLGQDMPQDGNNKGFTQCFLNRSVHAGFFCVWVCPVFEKKRLCHCFSWMDLLCWGKLHVGKTNMVNHLFLDQSVHAGHLIPGYFCLRNKRGSIIVFWSVCTWRTFCVWVCPVLEKKGWISIFLIGLCKHDLLWLGMPVLERKRFVSLFSRSVCSCRTCVLECLVLERKEPLSLFFLSVFAWRTFCVWVCPVLEKKRLYHCFLNWSVHAGPLICGYDLCWKEIQLSPYSLDQSVHAGAFVSV